MLEVDADLSSSLDLVNFLRRLRSHGFALSLLLDSSVLKLLSKRSVTKPAKPAGVEGKVLAWKEQEPASY